MSPGPPRPSPRPSGLPSGRPSGPPSPRPWRNMPPSRSRGILPTWARSNRGLKRSRTGSGISSSSSASSPFWSHCRKVFNIPAPGPPSPGGMLPRIARPMAVPNSSRLSSSLPASSKIFRAFSRTRSGSSSRVILPSPLRSKLRTNAPGSKFPPPPGRASGRRSRGRTAGGGVGVSVAGAAGLPVDSTAG